ncbi:MAG: ABC-F family ATP-binding cassette domain-containing protein [bacterium]
MIDLQNLSIQFSGDNLFENVNLRINNGDKIALVGSNGSGKSTFLKLLIGIEKPETGNISKQRGIKIGYLPQELIQLRGKPLFDEVKSSLQEINDIVVEENKINDQLSSQVLSDEKKFELLHRLGDLTHRKEEINFYSIDSEIGKVLVGLGFKEEEFTKLTHEFSGGWQMRIELAKLLLSKNDLLMMDEPTNHLDLDSLQWLIEFLHKFKGALIIVSHDRFFINEVTDRTLEIFNNSISFYRGNYEEYLVFKEERDKRIKEMIRVQELKRKATERFIERFRYKATKARQVQNRIKQLEKFESFELPDDEEKIKLKFPDPPKSGIVPIELINISKSYGNNDVLVDVSLLVERGDKIALVGPNGAGKTTISKIIAQKLLPDSGEVKLGHNTTFSYYAQEVAENLDLDKDIFESIEDIATDLTPGQIRNLLGSFLFSDDEVFKKVKVLSGGEKSRVALARILLTSANLIVMDEPTNHLDFSSKRILQKALIDFSGSLIIVSHDIDFIKPITNKIVEVRNKQLRIYPGGIDYYLHKKNEQIEAEQSLISAQKAIEGTSNKKDQKRSEAELRQKRYAATKDIKQQIVEIEKEIGKLEELKMTTEKELSSIEIYSSPEIAKEKNKLYAEVKETLETTFHRWAELTEQLEVIEKSFAN